MSEKQCLICASNIIETTYIGKIRDGAVGNYTRHDVFVQQCGECGVIWHNNSVESLSDYYESDKYRNSMNEEANESVFNEKHDYETNFKLQCTGTDIYRDKIVADVGCGAGAFLDFVKGPAKTAIGIEPTKKYHSMMKKRSISPYSYVESALAEYSNSVDVITSFDVIEHVESPQNFMDDAYSLVSNDGLVIIGTPTDAPVMRSLLGSEYESFLFSTQHPWVLTEQSLRILAERAGFKNISFKYFQRYGLSNILLWLKEKKPPQHKSLDFISDTIDFAWKSELESKKMSDYIVLYCSPKESL